MIINRIAIILAAMLAMSIFAATGVGSSIVVQEGQAISPVPGMEQAENFTKLDISPRYSNLRLKAGENKEMTVTVKNKEKKTVGVRPNILVMPYGEQIADREWIEVKPENAEIPAGGSQKFTIKATVPKDASPGSYPLQIAFTDEIAPTPYPSPMPIYIHSLQLSIDVWTQPMITIMTPYIGDQLEAGNTYDYEIKMKNIGDKAIGIDPKLGSDMYYGPYGPMGMVLTDDAFTISAPQSIPAGATEIVKVQVRVPADARGYYNGYIDLGIDDPSVREYEGRVGLNFNIWKQPAEAYVKSFSLKESAPLTIDVSSNYYGSPYPTGQRNKAKDPSFEISLEGPGGKADLTLVKKVLKGNINMGGEIPPWEIDSTGIYQETGVQYMETYKIDGSVGEWKLKILPRNTQGFEYSITIGGE